MKRLHRDPMRFDIFQVFAAHGMEGRVALTTREAAEGFLKKVRSSIDEALRTDSFLYGQWVQALFLSLVVSLGCAEMVKEEDAGETYALDEGLQVPDYFIVLPENHRLLVEVKNHFQGKDPALPFVAQREYFDGLARYSALRSCPLKIAVYWVVWNMWTLVDPSAFRKEGTKLVLSLESAMVHNEMSRLGDFLVGTKPPLCLRLLPDPSQPTSFKEDTVQFTIGDVDLYCAGRQIQDKREREIAFYLMVFGRWTEKEALVEKDAKGNVKYVELCVGPEEESTQGFEFIGEMSSMFSNQFRYATAEEGKVQQLRTELVPGSLGRLIPREYKGKDLPLWCVVQATKHEEVRAAPEGQRNEH